MEPKIQIGDYVLSEAQAMTVRVAVSTFCMQLADDTYRNELGPVGDAYLARSREVEIILVGQCK